MHAAKHTALTALLSPVLLAALTISPAHAAPSAAAQTPPKAPVAGTPQHTENSQTLPFNGGYKSGYKAGRSDGAEDGFNEQCDEYKPGEPSAKKSKSYKRGYVDGYYKGFYETCDE